MIFVQDHPLKKHRLLKIIVNHVQKKWRFFVTLKHLDDLFDDFLRKNTLFACVRSSY